MNNDKYITEDRVTFEIAKLLEEKGFDEHCDYVYDGTTLKWLFGMFIFFKEPSDTNSKLKEYGHDGIVTAPTVQMALKWLREVHKIFINVSNEVSLTDDDITYRFFVCTKEKTILHRGEDIKTFEDACNEAMKFALENLI